MGEPLWDWEVLVAAAGGKADGAPARAITGFSIDTRALQAGEVFVALKDVRDGHEFVSAAFQNGAAAALVAADYGRREGDGALIRVDDPLRALERIAIAARARISTEARVVAVTGSAGKTTTKEMLRVCFEAVSPGRVHASVKSYNNHWGVPLTLARMPRDTLFGVFEIGMNHAGEIRPLTGMVRPHIAVVTSVLPVHVGNFDDGIEGIAKAKAEIFEGLETDGVAIVPGDNPHLEILTAAAEKYCRQVRAFRRIEFPLPANLAGLADGDLGYAPLGARTTTIGQASINRVQMTLAAPTMDTNRNLDLDLSLLGDHQAGNAAALVLALDSAKVAVTQDVRDALTAVRAEAGRGEATVRRDVIGAAPILLIDESYNANPASVAAAIRVAGEVKSRQKWDRLVVVLGDMLELGTGSAEYHRALKGVVAEAGVDTVFAAGPMMRQLYDELPEAVRGGWAESSGSLNNQMLTAVRGGDVVMVKGSLGSRMGPLTAALKDRYPIVFGGSDA